MEEEKENERMSLFGKRHGSEGSKKVTMLGTNDISSFFTAKKPVLFSCTSELHTLNDVSAAGQPCEEIQGIADIGLSFGALENWTSRLKTSVRVTVCPKLEV
jgi:hypothetical protein